VGHYFLQFVDQERVICIDKATNDTIFSIIIKASAAPVDNGGDWLDLKQCREYIDDLKRNSGNEIDWGPLMKFMVKDLGCEELPKTGGSHVPFRHRILEKYQGQQGHFVVALHRNKILYRKNYLGRTYHVLKRIIDLLEHEDKNAEQRP
jgi:hypothetical protein